MKQHKISKGQHIIFSQGEWSDYKLVGLAIALKDFDMEEQRANFEYKKDWIFPMSAFMSSLISKGLITELGYFEENERQPWVDEEV